MARICGSLSVTMADLFSIIAFVATTIRAIIAANSYISSLTDELTMMEGLLRELGNLANAGKEDELGLGRIVREALANCEKISKKLDKLVRPFVNIGVVKGGKRNVTIWSRFAFGFKESDVLALEGDMVACKRNLTLAVTSADLCVPIFMGI